MRDIHAQLAHQHQTLAAMHDARLQVQGAPVDLSAADQNLLYLNESLAQMHPDY
jgi:hypothetical protein